MLQTAGRWLGLFGLAVTALGCAAFELAPDAAASEDEQATAGWPACIEQSVSVSGAQATSVGATAGELAELVQGSHANIMLWAGGGRTVVRVDVTDARVLTIRSRVNPARDASLGAVRCSDHARIEARLELRTDDGKLAASIDDAQLVVYGRGEARAIIELAGEELAGTYAPRLRDRECFLGTQLRVLFSTNGMHGSMIDSMGVGGCADDGSVGRLQYAAGHWGSRWQNY